MPKKFRAIFFSTLSLVALLVIIWLLRGIDIAVLNPKGWVAEREFYLIKISTWLMLIVIIPVFFLVFIFSWKYRASNKKAKYTPNDDQSLLAETIWWGIPFLIVIVLSVYAWKMSHELDPFKPLESAAKPMRIQVVALEWKWLFIYPEYQIASINFVQFPEKTPLNFEITSDAPMNSFWIPHLGSQIYAMSGMKTKLHLIANETGSFRGLSANLSGLGFSKMRFTAKSTTQEEFDAWVKSAQNSPNILNEETYQTLAEASLENPVKFYRLTAPNLFDDIVMKYMAPHGGN